MRFKVQVADYYEREYGLAPVEKDISDRGCLWWMNEKPDCHVELRLVNIWDSHESTMVTHPCKRCYKADVEVGVVRTERNWKKYNGLEEPHQAAEED